ncbi:C-type mannose receptor 2-like [Hemibagrus wyckioides]|uniref:C-type mannose receptor 2-like n=1 Tax=Hemibagrus wyckioides TaxID=337641 RepID=UPI00266CD21A|nr:C-type mannose receptor 2-like [Hemibagrus wyckioides]
MTSSGQNTKAQVQKLVFVNNTDVVVLSLTGFFSLRFCLPRQYHFINENKTWSEAQRYCRENYVDLVSINNTEEDLALMNTIGIWKSNRTWIGLYDDLNSWKWSLDDDSFYQNEERDFRSWYKNKPRNWNGEDFCVFFAVYYAGWRVASCSTTLPFMCFDGRVNASERYIPVYQHMNWTEAQRYCREHYTDLTSVRNETENQKIRSLLADKKQLDDNHYYKYYGDNYYFHYYYNYHMHKPFWIGLYRTRSWSDHSNSSFSNWKPGQPGNYSQNESCAAVSFNYDYYYGKWTDENCGQTFPFLCYSR